MNLNTSSRLSDAELVAEVKRLAGCEREAAVDLILHLAELDGRRLYLGAGFSSLFMYCTAVLRFSEHAAYHRILAARMARRFPVVLGMLTEGSLNLTSLRLLSPYLNAGNYEELLTAASGQSKRGLQELLARRFPQQDVASSIRRLPVPRPACEPLPALERVVAIASAAPTGAAMTGAAPALPSESWAPPTLGVPVLMALAPRSSLPPSLGASELAAWTPAPPLPSKHRPSVTPLAPERYQVTFTASARTREMLQLAQDLMRHSVPSGDMDTIFDEALTALLEKLARQKCAATEHPHASNGPADGSRHIPASVRRAVWVRDLGRCAFVSQDGRRCNERGFVEFHHVVPHGVGGPSTVGNLALRCRAHNGYEADLYYGPRTSQLGPDLVESSVLNSVGSHSRRTPVPPTQVEVQRPCR